MRSAQRQQPRSKICALVRQTGKDRQRAFSPNWVRCTLLSFLLNINAIKVVLPKKERGEEEGKGEVEELVLRYRVDGPAVRSSALLSQKTGFVSQHLHGSSPQSVTSVPESLIGFCMQSHKHRHTQAQTHTLKE